MLFACLKCTKTYACVGRQSEEKMPHLPKPPMLATSLQVPSVKTKLWGPSESQGRGVSNSQGLTCSRSNCCWALAAAGQGRGGGGGLW